MKIALVGTSGTGKSSLAKAIHERYDIPYIPEFVREVKEYLGIENLRKMTPEQGYLLQKEVLERKLEAESSYDSFIADRSTADNLAYYLRWQCRVRSEEENQAYFEKCLENLCRYDKVIILPWMGIPLENDGVRSTNIFHLYEMYCMVLGVLQSHHIEYEVLLEPDFEKRVDYLAKYYIE